MDVPRDISALGRDDRIALLNALLEGEQVFADPVESLRLLLGDEDAEVRKLAVSALWDYPRPDMLDPLFDMVYNDPDQEVRNRAVVTLGRYIYEGDMAEYDSKWTALDHVLSPEILSKRDFLRVRDFLFRLIQDETQLLDTRRFAVEAISFLDGPDVTEVIRQAYEHPEMAMKVSAVFAMGRNASRIWAPILLKELESPVPELKLEATKAVGESYLKEAFPLLKRIAEQETGDLQLEAIWALGKTGVPEARSLLERYAESDDPDVHEIASAALEEMDELGLA